MGMLHQSAVYYSKQQIVHEKSVYQIEFFMGYGICNFLSQMFENMVNDKYVFPVLKFQINAKERVRCLQHFKAGCSLPYIFTFSQKTQ